MSCTVDDLAKELSGLFERLSTQVRTLTLGLLAFTAGILSGVLGFGKDPHPVLPHWVEINLLLIAASLFVVLLSDLVQCALSIESTKATITDAEGKIARKEIAEDATILFNFKRWDYRGAFVLFWGKIWLLCLTTVWFAGITFTYCIRNFH